MSFSKRGFLGSVEDALSYGANALMFYTGAPQNTIRKEINLELVEKAKDLMELNDFDMKNVICHAPYIVNLATAKKEQWDFSVNFLKQEIERCKIMGVKSIVIHPGNAVGIEKSEGLDNLIVALKLLVNIDVMILIETMAGKGTELCSTMDELEYVLNKVDSSYLGVCLDTCHLNDSGINIEFFDEYLLEFDKKIGIEKIRCIHLNDSKNEIGMKKDRHENFGIGSLGFDTLINVCYNEKLEKVPKILETPFVNLGKDSYPPYKFEIEMIKNKSFNKKLLEVIINYYK